MDVYSYTAILSKTVLMQGKITYTDRRQRTEDCLFGLPLDSEVVTGHTLAGNETQAKTLAIALLKRSHPQERQYGNHENVIVRPEEEMDAEASD